MLKNKFALAAASALMTLNMVGAANVFANGDSGNTADSDITAVLNKTVIKDKNTVLPATNFEFEVTIASKDELDDLPGESEGMTIPVYAGMNSNDLEVTNPTKPDETGVGEESVSYNAGSVKAKKDAFAGKDAGVYRYKISEKNTGYEDLKYDETVYYVDVYVTVKENTTAATGMRVFKNLQEAVGEGNNVKKSGFDFTNDYSEDPNNNPNNELHAVKVKKIITGNQANTKATFNFEITVNGATGESYYYESTDGEKGYLNAKTKKDIVFSNNETVTIYGLSKNDTVNVVETKANQDGYKTEVEETDYQKSAAATEDQEAKPSTPGTVTVTNTREGTIPTGILMTAAPYAGMIGLGGIFAGLFFRRKRED